MSVELRREMLVNYLREKGRTAVTELAEHFNITGATVRSDLRYLEQTKQVTRRYGGAEAVTHSLSDDRPLDEKTSLNQDIKKRIGAKAASLVHDGDSIILDNGSTTVQMVQWLVEKVALTVMTNSLLIANEFVARDSNVTLLMPGGAFRKRSSSFHGGLAEQAFRFYTFDKLFIGADGFDIELGTTTFIEAYQVSQSMCQAAKQIIVVIDSSKFGRKTPNIVVPIDKIDIVITDSGISDEDKRALEDKDIQVLIV
ncbi:glucitol operon DNA-binding transcriptional repressor SrlR [Aeromonas veronii]|uniref:glucitol operon DNA-binding transcriptional repressor SrlR n=1 Tax=Aeromonas veronii TaxID=654 RepID=UPI002F3E3009